MKLARTVVLCIAAVVLVSSCQYMTLRKYMTTGDVRLTRMQMPDVVREGLPYDVRVSFDAEFTPQFKKACFRWVAETMSGVSPALYYHAAPVSSNQPIGSPGSQWQNEAAEQSSPEFCVGPENIRTNVPGELYVRIYPEDLRPGTNKLVGYFEYVQDGEVFTTNKVSTRVLMGDE